MSKFDQAGFFIFVLVFVSRDSELDQYLSGDLRKICSSDLNEILHVGIRQRSRQTSLFKDEGSKISNQGKSTVSPPRD